MWSKINSVIQRAVYGQVSDDTTGFNAYDYVRHLGEGGFANAFLMKRKSDGK